MLAYAATIPLSTRSLAYLSGLLAAHRREIGPARRAGLGLAGVTRLIHDLKAARTHGLMEALTRSAVAKAKAPSWYTIDTPVDAPAVSTIVTAKTSVGASGGIMGICGYLLVLASRQPHVAPPWIRRFRDGGPSSSLRVPVCYS